MHKQSQKIKTKKIKELLMKGKSLSNIDIPSLNESFPEGFLLGDNGHEEDIVSLFYMGKRIATFNATKVMVETINNRIKRFSKNKHKF
jgi:hypothetical protein